MNVKYIIGIQITKLTAVIAQNTRRLTTFFRQATCHKTQYIITTQSKFMNKSILVENQLSKTLSVSGHTINQPKENIFNKIHKTTANKTKQQTLNILKKFNFIPPFFMYNALGLTCWKRVRTNGFHQRVLYL